MAVEREQALWHYRSLQASDLETLQQALPGLLGGEWSLATLEHLLHEQENPRAHQGRVLCPAAADSATPVAFAEFVIVLDECQLLNIAVLQSHQHQGLGSRLLAELLGEAEQQGCISCALDVRSSNSAALALYESAGFRQVGQRKDYYPRLQQPTQREDALLFECRLA